MRRVTTYGFTLVELLVVVMIVSLLVAITLPVYMRMGRNQKQSTCMNDMRELGTALTLYWQDNNFTYPRAPHPGYLRSQGQDSTYLPYSKNPMTGPWEVKFTGTGQSGLTTAGTFTGTAATKFRIEIDGVDPDTFRWSDDDGATWRDSLIRISGGRQTLDDGTPTGIEITFSAKSGHVIGDAWTFSIVPVLPGWTVWQGAAGRAALTVLANPGDTSLTALNAGYLEPLVLKGPVSISLTDVADGDTEILVVTAVSALAGNKFSLTLDAPVTQGYDPGGVLDAGHAPAATLTLDVTAGTDTVEMLNAGGLPWNVPIYLMDKAKGVSETLVITSVTSVGDPKDQKYSVEFATPLLRDYTAGTRVDPGYTYSITADPDDVPEQNFGLATMYYLFFNDEKDYLRSRQYLHCPALLKTKDIDRSANLTALENSTDADIQASSHFREFDPLWAGYNNYDFTYNYDQYTNEILAHDAAIGFGNLNGARQLKNRYPPADTVVTWCYGHRNSPAIEYPDPGTMAFKVAEPTNDDELNNLSILIKNTENSLNNRRDLVLWVDGTVALMHPKLVRGRDIGGEWYYYWVPPFLYTMGDWRS